MKITVNRIARNVAIVFLILGVFYSGMQLFSEKTLKIKTMDAEAVIYATELIKAYQKDEAQSNAMYREKVLEITGVIHKVTFINNRNTVILHGMDKDTGVICDMNDDQDAFVKQLKEGQTISIKGLCKGFLKDVILMNCILIKTPTHG